LTENNGKKPDETAVVAAPAAAPPLVDLDPKGGLRPLNFEGLYRLARIMAASRLMPKDIESVEAVFVCVQMGLEVGLSPMQAVQNIAPINGRPCIWGDAALALVEASGLLEEISETYEGEFPKDDFKAVCKVKRTGRKNEVIREFSIEDSKRAGLWENPKKDPWKKYPKRMLQMRARAFSLRDGFPDVLKGLRISEEVLDYDVDLHLNGSGSYSVEDIREKTIDKIEALKDRFAVDDPTDEGDDGPPDPPPPGKKEPKPEKKAEPKKAPAPKQAAQAPQEAENKAETKTPTEDPAPPNGDEIDDLATALGDILVAEPELWVAGCDACRVNPSAVPAAKATRKRLYEKIEQLRALGVGEM
jgi:hypothetical protein